MDVDGYKLPEREYTPYELKVIKLALAHPVIQEDLRDKEIKKIIVVKDRLINFVID